MKKVKYLAMLLAAGMFAACSDNLEDTGAGNAGGTTPATGEGYIKIAINLPTTSGNSTRAENDQFDEGLDKEYKVGNNNIIAIFEGTSETDAKLTAAYNNINFTWSTANPDVNVTTTSADYIQQVPQKTNENNKLFALVILNPSDVVTVSGSKLIIGSTEVTNLSSLYTKISQETLDITKFVGTSTDAFLMTNAPIASLSGTDSNFSSGENVTTLSEVQVFDDENAAQAYAGDDIYVERVVAKITLSEMPKTVTTTDANNPLNGAAIKNYVWTIDNKNKSTKLVRDVMGDNLTSPVWKTWMAINNTTSVSGNRFFGTEPDPYRVYWGIDCNYTTTGLTDLTEVTAGSTIDITTTPEGWHNNTTSIEYCLENTFEDGDATNRGDNAEATRALFAVAVSPNITEDGEIIGNSETGKVSATDFILIGESSAIYTKTTFITYMNQYAAELLPEGVNEYELNTITAGREFTKASELYGTDGLFRTGVTETNADDVLGFLSKVRYYKNNVMYYGQTVIEHFGDNGTQVVEGTLPQGANYLGRYGVLRNNWYEMKVTKVGIGSPSIPNDDGKLDEEEAYINCRINILSWAKRSQDVEL